MNHLQPLDKKLRSQLENTVKKARDIAEEAALAVLEQLGVGEKTKPSYLDDTQQNLRVRLRAHARSLGDARKPDGEQSIDRLQEEVAYEHWHRMLFARFLAENNLLMYPDPDEPVAISLEECEDLAADEGATNGWELAGRYASQMLPQIFRVDSPVFELKLAPNHQLDLEKLLISLPTEVFTASDSLGWVYQFWQANNKERINKSEVKIGARELPAVTQLFTEPYMVSFLLDNSLGAWWAARRLSEDDFKNACSEDELRQKAAIDGVPLEYLRFVQDDNGLWSPAAGTFDGWPEQLAELKSLDPCCGSGHFLVSAFLMLVPMRMELEGLTAQEAVDAVLSQNIHGLELDQRCVELAAFNLALTAWKYPRSGGYRVLPELHVACSGLAINAKREDWTELAGDNADLRRALDELYSQFKDAPVLGSLINPEKSLNRDSLFELDWNHLAPALASALDQEKDNDKAEMGVVARGMTKAAALLAQRYDFIQTNVPYLGISKQNTRLMEHVDRWYSVGKYDLALAFIERIKDWIKPKGAYSLVSLGEWLYLGPYTQYRENFIDKHKPLFVLRLGWNAFSTPIRANPALIISSAGDGKSDEFSLSDCSANKHLQENISSSIGGDISRTSRDQIRLNPDLRFICSDSSHIDLLVSYADARSGLHAGDLHQFFKLHWEVPSFSWVWEPVQTAVNETEKFSAREQIIRWENERGSLAALAESVKHLNHAAQNWRAGKPFWGLHGIAVGLMGKAACAIYSGERYDVNSSAIIPKEEQNLAPLWCYCESGEFSQQVRLIDNSLKLAPKTLLKIPFDAKRWNLVAAEKYPNGLPKPYTDDSTQWIFHGHPCGSVVWDETQKCTADGTLRTDETVLHIAVARLLGYRWPTELDIKMELADEQREWVRRCEALLPLADEDGVVCIPAVRGEALASDRLINLLAAAYGDAWTPAMLDQLLSSVGYAGKTLDAWLRDKFFEQHVKLFQNRPFIWHIWDGLNDGFAVLINYHKFDQKLLETLIYTYLGDWIKRQKDEIAAGMDGAQERLAAAENLRKRLIKILEGEAPLDIFVRWKPLEQQPIGWNPDLNDGVRLNIRPFILVDDVKVKGAGVLRNKIPSIKWTKDRGADVESAPWYHLGPQYGGKEGDRINEHHLSLAEKKAAREAVK